METHQEARDADERALAPQLWKKPRERLLWAARWLEEAGTSGKRDMWVSPGISAACFLVKVQLYQYTCLHSQVCSLKQLKDLKYDQIRKGYSDLLMILL